MYIYILYFTVTYQFSPNLAGFSTIWIKSDITEQPKHLILGLNFVAIHCANGWFGVQSV